MDSTTRGLSNLRSIEVDLETTKKKKMEEETISDNSDSKISPPNVEPAANLPRDVKYIFAMQFFSRGITFLFNTWMVRQLTEEDLKLSDVDFHLFTTFVFCSREGYRIACLREDIRCDDDSATAAKAAKLLEVAWKAIPIGIFATIAAWPYVFLWKSRCSFSSPYAQAILLHGIACLFELLAEPVYILSQNLLLLRLRLVVETLATLTRCATTYVLILKQPGLEKSIIFSFSQAAYGASICIGYWGYFLLFRVYRTSVLFSFRIRSMMTYDCPQANLCMVFTVHSFCKWFLLVVEMLVFWWRGISYNVPVYGRVENLGSLVVRLIFLPVEESSYNTFARLASGDDREKQKNLGRSLTHAMKLVLLIGLVVVAFGPSYSYPLLRILYGRKWSDGEASTALKYYCLYVVVLAMNGTSEVFWHAVANEYELKESKIPLTISVFCVILNVFLIQTAGTVGLILAKFLKMLFRIMYSAFLIKKYFKGSSAFSFRGCWPRGSELLLVSGVATFILEREYLNHDNFWATFFGHFSFGVVCFSVAAFVIYQKEKPFFRELVRSREHTD